MREASPVAVVLQHEQAKGEAGRIVAPLVERANAIEEWARLPIRHEAVWDARHGVLHPVLKPFGPGRARRRAW